MIDEPANIHGFDGNVGKLLGKNTSVTLKNIKKCINKDLNQKPSFCQSNSQVLSNLASTRLYKEPYGPIGRIFFCCHELTLEHCDLGCD